MKVLIIGNGGREHALAWKVAQSPQVDAVFVAPGNAGTVHEPKVHNVAIPAQDTKALALFCQNNQVDLTIVGPEGPLVAGLVDYFTQAGLAVIGPNAAAAQLEGSKSYAKAFLARHHIPSARYETFTDIAAARAYLIKHPGPHVVKADGLAAGKGVVVAANSAEAEQAATTMLAGAFGKASAKIVIEERLEGREASYIILTDGHSYIPFASSEDHKRRDDGDRGPNTGGMGAFSPASALDGAQEQIVRSTIIEPTLAGLAKEGLPYVGFLYAGLMMTANGPQVLEFNCRFGDPETQPILMRLQSDLVSLLQAALRGELKNQQAIWDPRPALCVVMAAGGYPGSYAEGDVITGLGTDTPLCKVFHAGTKIADATPVTAGGRVLGVTALGQDLQDARRHAYDRVRAISFARALYRHDIGERYNKN